MALIAMFALSSCKAKSSSKVSENRETSEAPLSKKVDNPKGKGRGYYDLFDTVSQIFSYSGDSEEEFIENCDDTYYLLLDYHKLFDIYHEYSGMNNLCSINRNAGGEWLEVDPRLVEFLLYARELYDLTGGEMNIMMGSVLSLWHEARNSSTPYLPDRSALEEAGRHISFEALEIDEKANRVRITDPLSSIDVGALGKGYATEMAARALEEKGVTSYVLNIGGNIRIIGSKVDGSGWKTGIRDPNNPEGDFALTITVKDTAVVTSGSYERFFTVDGVRYPHIIDKDTLEPSRYFESLTVLCRDSGLADCLSTALYCMPLSEGRRLVDSLDGVDCIWIDSKGTIVMTDGASALVEK